MTSSEQLLNGRDRINDDGPVTVTFATVRQAQAAFLACERQRVGVGGRWPTGWEHDGHESELTIHYALREIEAHDF